MLIHAYIITSRIFPSLFKIHLKNTSHFYITMYTWINIYTQIFFFLKDILNELDNSLLRGTKLRRPLLLEESIVNGNTFHKSTLMVFKLLHKIF